MRTSGRILMDFVDFLARWRQNSAMRWLLLLLFITGSALAVEPGEPEAFAAATKASQDGFYERSEKAWADFLTRFPKSDRKAEAALAQAQARQQLKNFAGALELLTARLPEAGLLADQFRFWRGQTLLDLTNYIGAEDAFAEMLKTDTNSPLRLNAAVGQGTARFKKGDFPGVVELLGNTNGVFQQLANASTNATQVARGILLLAESQLRRSDLNAARTALQSMGAKSLPQELEWERAQMQARVEFAGPNPDQALPALTNAVARARATKNAGLIAESLNLEAEVQKRLNRLDRAGLAYGGIVATEGMPLDQKRMALLKQVELSAAQSAFTNAAGTIALFLTQNPTDPAADSLQIKAGELMLEAYRAQTNKLTAPATNYIAEARGLLETAIQKYTNSPHLGKAWLNKGWTLWEEHDATGNRQRLAESQAAFQAAADKLPAGDDQALARLKSGEALFKQEAFLSAATNFEAVVNAFVATPGIRTNIAGRAAEQWVRANLAMTNLTAADAALQKTVSLFPSSLFAQQSWLTMAQICAELGDLPRARALLKDFGTKFPASSLKADADLSYARTFALENKWPEAIDLYTKWTASNPAHPSLAQAEFDRAWFNARAGQETNAFQAFTNFVARFPTNILAARAQFWIGNYYFNPPREQWSLAEQSYQQIFESTNWNVPNLACQARIAAARTAYFRQSYSDAKSHLTNLINSACSPEIVAEALFLLGDVLIEDRVQNSTNVLDNFLQAKTVFARITQMGPTNRFEPLAWGKMGDCYFQLGPNEYNTAIDAYSKVLGSKRADVPTAARNQAEVGIANVLEEMSKTRPPKESGPLQQQALEHLLNVVYAVGGAKPDDYWKKRAAQNAGRLAEKLKPDAALELYKRLKDEMPAMKTMWEAKISALESSGQIQ